MKLPSGIAACLWSYDLGRLDLERDRKTIITQVLNFGGLKEGAMAPSSLSTSGNRPRDSAAASRLLASPRSSFLDIHLEDPRFKKSISSRASLYPFPRCSSTFSSGVVLATLSSFKLLK